MVAFLIVKPVLAPTQGKAQPVPTAGPATPLPQNAASHLSCLTSFAVPPNLFCLLQLLSIACCLEGERALGWFSALFCDPRRKGAAFKNRKAHSATTSCHGITSPNKQATYRNALGSQNTSERPPVPTKSFPPPPRKV